VALGALINRRLGGLTVSDSYGAMKETTEDRPAPAYHPASQLVPSAKGDLMSIQSEQIEGRSAPQLIVILGGARAVKHLRRTV